MRRIVIAVALGLMAVYPGAARAEISYSYIVGDTSADASNNINFNVATGGTVTVNLYLHESLPSGTSSLIAADGGMAGAAASITLKSGSTSTAALQSFASTVNLSGFGSGSFRFGNDSNINGTSASNNNPSQTAFGVSTANGVGTASNVNPDSNGNILIGTVTINAGAQGGTVQYALSNYPPAGKTSGNTITAGTGPSASQFGFFDLDYTNNLANGNTTPSNPPYLGTLDPSNATFFTVTVTAVPEPSSMALCGLVAVGMGYVGYRRRKNGALTQEAVA